MNGPEFAGLVLAAGRGTRLASEHDDLPKVIRPLLGRPMVSYVLDTLAAAGVEPVTLVVGYRSEDVKRVVGRRVGYVLQPEQKGSGHAVMCARTRFSGFDGHVVIMCGDSPLFTVGAVRRLMAEHIASGAAVTLVSAVLDRPAGYGRIVRGQSGQVVRVVEEKCAVGDERVIKEVNGGAYAFDAGWLFSRLDAMAVNHAGEYNLTDMVRVAIEDGRIVSSVSCDPSELLGVNTAEDMHAVEGILRRH